MLRRIIYITEADQGFVFPDNQVMNLPEGILGLFVTSFEPGVGNSIIWKYKNPSNDEDPEMDGVEYTSMPSGMHLMNSDEIYFTTEGDNHGIAIYRKIPSADQHERGVKMFSVGVITRGTYTPYDYLPELEELSLYLLTNRPSDVLLEMFFAPIQSSDNDHITQQSPSPKALSLLFDVLGPLLLLLFRLLLAQKRVVIFFRPTEGKGVGWISAALKSFSEILNNDDDGLISESRTRYIGNVGLTDLERLESVKRGYIASTTDALLLEKPQVYDAIIDLSPKVKYPSLYISQTHEKGALLTRQTYTLADLNLWRKLRSRIDSQTLVSSPPYGFADLFADIWSSIFGANSKMSIPSPTPSEYYPENEPNTNEDDEVRLLRKSLNPSPAIAAFMKKYSNAILASLLALALKPDYDHNENVRDEDHHQIDGDNVINDDRPLELSAADLLTLGLSPLSDVDSLVAKTISKTELGRSATVSVSCAWSVASFVRRQFLSIGWI
ncbi:hypothetical protein E3P94_02676 [Wallemia ichthyophaga]|nr:hypothetical protein E3P95_02625 [Wallemia ichthyophaga]TIA99075.1 hypothetical protein E3P94_02676 [Wallemia ichthyophaga]